MEIIHLSCVKLKSKEQLEQLQISLHSAGTITTTSQCTWTTSVGRYWTNPKDLDILKFGTNTYMIQNIQYLISK